MDTITFGVNQLSYIMILMSCLFGFLMGAVFISFFMRWVYLQGSK